jgi:hypothetical protein
MNLSPVPETGSEQPARHQRRSSIGSSRLSGHGFRLRRWCQATFGVTLRALAAQLFQTTSNCREIVCDADAVHQLSVRQSEA